MTQLTVGDESIIWSYETLWHTAYTFLAHRVHKALANKSIIAECLVTTDGCLVRRWRAAFIGRS